MVLEDNGFQLLVKPEIVSLGTDSHILASVLFIPAVPSKPTLTMGFCRKIECVNQLLHRYAVM